MNDYQFYVTEVQILISIFILSGICLHAVQLQWPNFFLGALYSTYRYNHLARERLNGGVAVCIRKFIFRNSNSRSPPVGCIYLNLSDSFDICTQQHTHTTGNNVNTQKFRFISTTPQSPMLLFCNLLFPSWSHSRSWVFLFYFSCSEHCFAFSICSFIKYSYSLKCRKCFHFITGICDTRN